MRAISELMNSRSLNKNRHSPGGLYRSTITPAVRSPEPSP